MQHESILIIGGGPVGATAAIILAKSGKNVTIIDEFKNSKHLDARVLALSYASLAFLDEIGLSFKTFGTPINKVHISHNGLGINNIDASDINLEHLGYTIKYTDIVNELYSEMRKYPTIKLKKALVKNVIPGDSFATVMYVEDGFKDGDIVSQEQDSSSIVTADLVILAEGGNIKLNNTNYKQHDYKQHAIIARIKPQSYHNNIAYERFEEKGPLVLLPHDNEFIMVWALDNLILKNNDYDEINRDILYKMLCDLPFMKRFGNFTIINDIVKFPLRLQVADERVLDSVVLVGNSSQIVHPVSAQGLNLGLRDVRELCELLNGNKNIINALKQYSVSRKNDVRFVSGFTHFLAKFLEMQNPIINRLRSAGIITLSNCKLLQNKITHSLIFGV